MSFVIIDSATSSYLARPSEDEIMQGKAVLWSWYLCDAQRFVTPKEARSFAFRHHFKREYLIVDLKKARLKR